eukprot:scaffold23089_cov36-Phaeocystis_antarctica.AAC.1
MTTSTGVERTAVPSADARKLTSPGWSSRWALRRLGRSDVSDACKNVGGSVSRTWHCAARLGVRGGFFVGSRVRAKIGVGGSGLVGGSGQG